MSHLIAVVAVIAIAIAIYVYRKVVIAKVEADYNTAHTWILANGATYEQKIVAGAESVWTVVKGDLKGIGATIVKAVEDLKAKL